MNHSSFGRKQTKPNPSFCLHNPDNVIATSNISQHREVQKLQDYALKESPLPDDVKFLHSQQRLFYKWIWREIKFNQRLSSYTSICSSGPRQVGGHHENQRKTQGTSHFSDRQNHDPESKSKARRWVSAAALGETENKHLKQKESPADKPLGNICWLYPKAEKTDDVSVKRPPKHSQQIPKESGQEIPASNLQRNKCK